MAKDYNFRPLNNVMADLHFSNLLHQLHGLRSRFGKQQAEIKTGLLKQLMKLRPGNKRELLTYHDLLLFLLTYPDSPSLLTVTREAMDQLTKYIDELSTRNPAGFEFSYRDTGIINSIIKWEPSLDACKWLVQLAGNDITLQWSDAFTERLGPFLPHFGSGSEQDGLTNDKYDAKDWFILSSGCLTGDEHGHLTYLLRKMSGLQCEYPLKDHLFETLQPELKIRLRNSFLSRTTNLIVPKKYFFQHGPLVRVFDPAKVIQKKITAAKLLRGPAANRVIDMARAVLAVRARETDPFSYAGQVRKIQLERGLILYLFTMTPERRMPLENYTGFLALRNGVPIGYGGGWIFIERCEIGVNIFETFRGGENSYIFTNILRAYNRVFGIKKFVVPPYQFGADNDEGLKSGAFWFYYKLGFRPTDPDLELLAGTEFNKIAKSRSYLTPLRMLKKLSEAPLSLTIGRTKYRMEPKDVSIIITKWIASEFNADQQSALRFSLKQLDKLRTSAIKNTFNNAEKSALNSLSIFIALPDIIASFKENEKSGLIKLIKLKAHNEIAYSLQLKKQVKLLDAWQLLVDADRE